MKTEVTNLRPLMDTVSNVVVAWRFRLRLRDDDDPESVVMDDVEIRPSPAVGGQPGWSPKPKADWTQAEINQIVAWHARNNMVAHRLAAVLKARQRFVEDTSFKVDDLQPGNQP